MIDSDVVDVWRRVIDQSGHLTVLTGAGISAESGIPTFRGSDGYWTIGSREYHPQEMATYAMFLERPDEVWKWYYYRRAVCLRANPNPGHLALVEMEKRLGDRFVLITQNVDGLHLRAGNTSENTYQIHGNINYMRCASECSPRLYPIPEEIPLDLATKEFSTEIIAYLVCPACGKPARPHVLWFDESYNEEFYRFESSMRVARQTDVLLIVGTSGATTLPNHILRTVIQNRGVVIDVNVEPNSFSRSAEENGGHALTGPSGEILPQLLELIP
jgi:NAD-dependent deacetylase